jgi:hypothetical protein
MPLVCLACPGCQGTFETNAPAGQQVACIHCGQTVLVPAGAVPPAGWYLTRDNQRYGPYEREQLGKMAGAGNVRPTDLVWREGMPGWVEARSLGDLFPAGWANGALAAPARHPAAGGAGGLFTPRVRRAVAALGAFLWLQLRRATAVRVAAVPVSPREAERLAARGVEGDTIPRYFVWRRSMFLVVAALTCVTAWGQLRDALTKDYDKLTGYGVFVEIVGLLAGLCLPAAAVGAGLTWTRLKVSRRLMLAGWMASFLVPVFFALFPYSWQVQFDPAGSKFEHQVQEFATKVLAGLAYYLALTPAVLSLLPGVLRACLRLKGLLPETTLPGWLLVLGSPFYTLLVLAVFVLIIQIAGSTWLILGLLCWMAAPLVYPACARVLTRPLPGPEAKKLAYVQLAYAAVAGLSIFFLVIYVLTFQIPIPVEGQVVEYRLIGLDPETSLERPWAIPRYLIDYLGWSLFVTALVVDYFLLMDLSAWSRAKEFVGSDAARDFDRVMEAVGRAIR